ncbi:MAG: hypothetical protein H5T86_08085, partial [Armatimonadetes bacterium]|nr:hypothetical protein [Armatimonadota bacterium]
PLIIRWPAGIAEPGRTISAFVTWNDLAPTICELAGARPMEGAHGRSIVPLLTSTSVPEDWPTEVFMQFTGTEYYYTQRIIFDGRYKYVFNAFDFDELYDLREDPGELVNLAHDPCYADEIERLCGLMWRWAKLAEDPLYTPYPTVALTPIGPGEAGVQFSHQRWWKYDEV